MGYYIHRLKNGRSLYRGREIKGGTHGFLRSKIWHLIGFFYRGERRIAEIPDHTGRFFCERISVEGERGFNLRDRRPTRWVCFSSFETMNLS